MHLGVRVRVQLHDASPAEARLKLVLPVANESRKHAASVRAVVLEDGLRLVRFAAYLPLPRYAQPARQKIRFFG